MYFKSLDYPVIVIDNDYESPRIGGILIRALVEELRSNDQRVLCGLNLDDARAGARTYVAASAVLISIDGSEASISDHFLFGLATKPPLPSGNSAARALKICSSVRSISGALEACAIERPS